MSDDDELQQLREQTDPGTRLDESSGETDGDDLEDEIVAMLGAIEDGEVSKTLSMRDERLAALVHGLEETDDLDDIGASLCDHLGREGDADIDRSEVLRLAVRVGLQEAAPDIVETAREAYARHASEQF